MRQLFSFVLFCYTIGDAVIAKTDSCKFEFSEIASKSNCYVKFEYIDSVGMKYICVYDTRYLRKQICENKGYSIEESVNYLWERIATGAPLLFTEIGNIKPFGIVTNKKFLRKWRRKGQKRFLKRFTYKSLLKDKFDVFQSKNVNILATAFSLGILLGPLEDDHYGVVYSSKCYYFLL